MPPFSSFCSIRPEFTFIFLKRKKNIRAEANLLLLQNFPTFCLFPKTVICKFPILFCLAVVVTKIHLPGPTLWQLGGIIKTQHKERHGWAQRKINSRSASGHLTHSRRASSLFFRNNFDVKFYCVEIWTFWNQFIEFWCFDCWLCKCV